MWMSIFGCMVSSVQKPNKLEKVVIIPNNSSDFFEEKNNPLYNEKQPWKLNWIPPKHLRIDKYYYKDDNV